MFKCLSLILILLPGMARAAPDADLWPYWATNDPASTTTVDHGAWSAFLARYRVVGDDGIARLRYGAVTAADRTALNDYIDRLAAVPATTLNRDEQRAFWVDLYNALTVRTVLNHYPVDSILDIDISPGVFSDGPWGAELVTVEGAALTLDDIEHRILRPIWADPRIHYVVNCASLGCPDIPAQAMTAANGGAMLDAAARAYVNHPRGVAIDADGALVVSSIYDWYGADFGDSDAVIIAHLQRYAESALAARLGSISEIDDDAYDWRLNDAP